MPANLPPRRSTLVGLLVTASLALTGVLASPLQARADSFCDSPTSTGVGIDFTQTPNSIRLSAASLLSTFQQLAKRVPPDAPKYVRLLLAADLVLVTKATKVTSTTEANGLARHAVALSTSVSGRAAVKYLFVKCNLPDPVDETDAPKTTQPATRSPNPARATPTPTTPAASGTADPCSIIPQQLAATALGTDPGPGESVPTPQGGQCSYGTDGGGLIVTMVKGPLPNGMTAKEWVTNANAAALAGIAKATQPVIYNTLTGIGDGAFVAGTGADPTKGFTSASLTFYVRDTFVTLLLSFTPATSEPVPRVTALARSVAPLVPH